MSEHPRWTEMKVSMLVHVPFFSSLLFDLMDVEIGKFPHIFGDLNPTAGTNGRKIWFDQDFLSSLTLPEAVFVLCHEIGHAMWLHMERGKKYMDLGFDAQPFQPRIYNMAADYVINDMLVKSGIGSMPKIGLLDSAYTNEMLVEDVYRELLKKMPPPRTIRVTANGKDGNEGDTLDVHIHADSNINEAQMKRAVQTAIDTAKAMGKLPAALKRFAEEFLKPQVSWQERLRYHVTRSISRDATTWNKPHRRRLVSQGIYMPSYTGFGAGDVAVFIDTSGSIGQDEINVFFSELDDILSTCNPTGVVLIGCDAAVNSVHYLSAGDNLKEQKIQLGGGGGTSFRPPFEWVRQNGYRPAAAIYFTDMCGDFPEHEPEYPTIWCRTTRADPPWGEVIDVDINAQVRS